MTERVYLSRRNLLILLSKLDRQLAGEATACTIVKHDNQHKTHPQTMPHIEVCAVEDDVYYADRGAGAMHPNDEVKIATDIINDVIKVCGECNGTFLVESLDSHPGVVQFETCPCQYK